MKIGDLVKSYHDGRIGMVMEEETCRGLPGQWVQFDETSEWKFYSFEERYDVEVVNEAG
jgi:hypothetical protein